MTEFAASWGLTLIFMFGILFGIMLMCYEDGVRFGFAKRIKCKFGKHTFKGYMRKPLYYCQRCKAPRRHPSLKAIQGGKKDLDVFFNL